LAVAPSIILNGGIREYRRDRRPNQFGAKRSAYLTCTGSKSSQNREGGFPKAEFSLRVSAPKAPGKAFSGAAFPARAVKSGKMDRQAFRQVHREQHRSASPRGKSIIVENHAL
jgi:hypothetical protein